MTEVGCLAFFFQEYSKNVSFAQKHGFDLMQVWYDKNGFAMHKNDHDPVGVIKEFGFPTIIHAVLDINEFEEHIPRLVEFLTELQHTELIIHPICQSEAITDQTIEKLSQQVGYAKRILQPLGIQIYLENNSKIDPIFTSSAEIEYIYREHPDVEFLLDLAHIDDYEHLREMVEIKMPGMLHIADRHLDRVHEHLPIGEGDIDYPFIFAEILPNFTGKVILEIIQSEADIVHSKQIIQSCLGG